MSLVPHGLAAEPWRAGEGLPEGLTIEGSLRARYETLDGRFRTGRSGGDQVLALRTLVRVEWQRERWTFGAELQDSRAELDDEATTLGAGVVDAAELLQAYVRWTRPDTFAPGATSRLQLGRLTIDLGSRRLVARNVYRNNSNAFSGVDWTWTAPRGREVRAFATLPNQRRPLDGPSIRDNQIELNDVDTDVSFSGIFSVLSPAEARDRVELYLFALDERDQDDLRTRDRRLWTLGTRRVRAPVTGRFDYDVEAVVQGGKARAGSAPDDTRDLDVAAYAAHATVGYTFDVPARWRVATELDMASGDSDPEDGDLARFDPLFGARVGDLGPTAIYGPWQRANLRSARLRVDVRPHRSFSAYVRLGVNALDRARDVWVETGVRDPSGASGRNLGSMLESRLRWDAQPGNVQVDVGIGRLWLDGVAEHAPNAAGDGDVGFLYGSVLLSF